METNWDWDYFYSGKIKEWEGCKTWKEKREWRKRHCDLAIEYIFVRWVIMAKNDVFVNDMVKDVQKSVMTIVNKDSWFWHRVFTWRFKTKIKQAVTNGVKQLQRDWRLNTEVWNNLVGDLPEIISSDIVKGFKTWTSPIIWMTKPENIIAWEFGKEKEKKNKKVKVENPSILCRIKTSVREQMEAYKTDIYINAMRIHDTCMLLDQAIEYFLRSRVPVSKIRMFRPSVDELRKYLEESVGKGRGTFLIGMYCKAYADEMPFLCGVFGDFGVFNACKRKGYFRSRNVVKVIRKVLKKFAKLPVDFEGYYNLLETLKQDGVAEIKIDGDIDSEQCVLEEIHDLIEKVVHPILVHLALAAIQRAEIGGGLPCWDEKFSRGCAYRFEKRTQGGLLDTASEDARVENELEGLKKFTLRAYDADNKEILERQTSSFFVYNDVYQWYWKKGKEMFDSEVIKSKLWEKKGK